MPAFLFLINLSLCLWMYFREPTFALRSFYVLSMVVFYFIPAALNPLIYPDYALRVPVELAWLLGSVLVAVTRWPQRTIEHLLQRHLPQRKIVELFLVLLVAVGVMAGLGFTPLSESARFIATTMYFLLCFLGIYSYYHRDRLGRFYIAFGALAFVCFVVFYTLLWTGFGRMMLARFFFVAFFFASMGMSVRRVRFLKAFALLLLPVFITISGLLRSDTATVGNAIAEGNGIGSVISPMMFTERLYYDMRDGNFPMLYGESYVVTLLFFVPRSLWPSKPPGFGRQMVPWYQPRSRHPGHSLAGTHLGEAFGNFGRAGVLIGPLVLYLYLFLIQVFFNLRKHFPNTQQIILLLCGVLYLASIPDLLWGGTFTAYSRAGVSILFSMPAIYLFLKVRLWGTPAAPTPRAVR